MERIKAKKEFQNKIFFREVPEREKEKASPARECRTRCPPWRCRLSLSEKNPSLTVFNELFKL